MQTAVDSFMGLLTPYINQKNYRQEMAFKEKQLDMDENYRREVLARNDRDYDYQKSRDDYQKSQDEYTRNATSLAGSGNYAMNNYYSGAWNKPGYGFGGLAQIANNPLITDDFFKKFGGTSFSVSETEQDELGRPYINIKKNDGTVVGVSQDSLVAAVQGFMSPHVSNNTPVNFERDLNRTHYEESRLAQQPAPSAPKNNIAPPAPENNTTPALPEFKLSYPGLTSKQQMLVSLFAESDLRDRASLKDFHQRFREAGILPKDTIFDGTINSFKAPAPSPLQSQVDEATQDIASIGGRQTTPSQKTTGATTPDYKPNFSPELLKKRIERVAVIANKKPDLDGLGALNAKAVVREAKAAKTELAALRELQSGKPTSLTIQNLKVLSETAEGEEKGRYNAILNDLKNLDERNSKAESQSMLDALKQNSSLNTQEGQQAVKAVLSGMGNANTPEGQQLTQERLTTLSDVPSNATIQELTPIQKEAVFSVVGRLSKSQPEIFTPQVSSQIIDLMMKRVPVDKAINQVVGPITEYGRQQALQVQKTRDTLNEQDSKARNEIIVKQTPSHADNRKIIETLVKTYFPKGDQKPGDVDTLLKTLGSTALPPALRQDGVNSLADLYKKDPVNATSLLSSVRDLTFGVTGDKSPETLGIGMNMYSSGFSAKDADVLRDVMLDIGDDAFNRLFSSALPEHSRKQFTRAMHEYAANPKGNQRAMRDIVNTINSRQQLIEAAAYKSPGIDPQFMEDILVDLEKQNFDIGNISPDEILRVYDGYLKEAQYGN